MLARKCDFCGGFYEHYSGVKCKGNAIMFVDIDTLDGYIDREKYDLCPDCMCQVVTMIREER